MDICIRHRLAYLRSLAFVLALAGAAVTLGSPRTAGAVPAFARKYHTSCATCHTLFPRLTAFGRVFRDNGYQFPGDDSEMVEDDAVELGVDAYKKLFPNAIWPTTIDHYAPVSVVVKAAVPIWERDAAANPDFTGLEPAFDVYFTNSIGSRVSVFAKAQLNGPDCENCHTYGAVVVNDILPHSTFKVGKFQPEYFGFHQQPFTEFHDGLGPGRATGNNTWNFGKDYGAELAGTVFGRGRYVVGVLEGRGGLPSSEKNIYARASWKLGGARIDDEQDAEYTPPAKNWRERSFEIGALAYKGWATLSSNDEVGAPVTVDDDFFAAAVDANLLFDDVNLFGAGIVEHHSDPTGLDTNVYTERYLGGVRYTYWPWVVPSVLFDYFNSELRGDYTFQLRGRVELLIRANLKLRADVESTRPIGEAFSFRSGSLSIYAGF